MDDAMDQRIYAMQAFESLFPTWSHAVEKAAEVEKVGFDGDLSDAKRLMDSIGGSLTMYAEKSGSPYPDLLREVVGSFSTTAIDIVNDMNHLEATVCHARPTWQLLMKTTERRCADRYIVPGVYPVLASQKQPTDALRHG